MAKKTKEESCCSPANTGLCCCKVESLVSVDERGQMVLPKDIRDKANIKAGDKLAVVSWEMGDGVKCICLIKSEELAGMVKDMLGPMMGEMSGKVTGGRKK